MVCGNIEVLMIMFTGTVSHKITRNLGSLSEMFSKTAPDKILVASSCTCKYVIG